MDGKMPDNERNGINRKTIVIAIILVVILLVGFVTLIINNNNKRKAYNNAIEQLNEGYYQSARNAFMEMGNYKDSSQYYLYCTAIISGETGDFEKAITELNKLSGFADSNRAMNYFSARDMEKGSMSADTVSDAIALYDAAGEFADSGERAQNLRNKLEKITAQEPTVIPTPKPTEESTTEPTEEPTEEPTAEPTIEPTIAPIETIFAEIDEGAEEASMVSTETQAEVLAEEPATETEAEEVSEDATEELMEEKTEEATNTPTVEPTVELTEAPNTESVPETTPVPMYTPTAEATEEVTIVEPTPENELINITETENAEETSNIQITGVVIDTDNLNIHRNASMKSDVLGGVRRGNSVKIDSVLNGWAKIVTEEGIEGYVSADYLDYNQETFMDETVIFKAIVNAKHVLYMREMPDVTSKLIRSIPDKTEVFVLEYKENNWAKVSIYGYTGYVGSNYLVIEEESNQTEGK